jgi:hypothetical protein
MRTLLVLAAVIGLAGYAAAGAPAPADPRIRATGVFDAATGAWTWQTGHGLPARPGVVVYSNTATSTTYAWPKQLGVLTGDDLILTGAGRLAELATSLFYKNPFSSEKLTYLAAEISFWDLASDPALDPPLAILPVTFDLSGIGGLAPEEAAVTTFTGLEVQAIDLPAAVVVAVRYSDPDVPDGRFGQLVFDPPEIGASFDQVYRDDPASPPPGWYSFGGDPVANLYWEIVLVEVDPCAGQLPADSNCDGEIDSFDIDPFVQALTDPSQWQFPCDFYCVNDMNEDGKVDSFDIDMFVACLLGDCP